MHTKDCPSPCWNGGTPRCLFPGSYRNLLQVPQHKPSQTTKRNWPRILNPTRKASEASLLHYRQECSEPAPRIHRLFGWLRARRLVGRELRPSSYFLVFLILLLLRWSEEPPFLLGRCLLRNNQQSMHQKLGYSAKHYSKNSCPSKRQGRSWCSSHHQI